MTNNPIIRFLFISILILRCDFIIAQLHTASAKSISLGSTGVSYSRGIDAINSNPANLAFFDRTNWEFSILPRVTANFSNSVFTYKIYKKYFTSDENGDSKYLTTQDKNDILSLFPDDKSENIISSGIMDILNVSINYKEIYGGFGISVRERAFSSTSIPKDAFKLLLFGNEINQNYNFNQLTGSGYWFREYALGYGFQFWKNGKSTAAFGINLKYLTGTAIYNMSNTSANFLTSDTSLNGRIKFDGFYAYDNFLDSDGKYTVFSSAGQGQSFDLGFSYISDDVIFLGLSVQDLGYIIWKKNVYEVKVDTSGIIKNITDENEYKPFEDLIKNHKSQLSRKSVMLPISIHAGIAVNLHQTYFLSEYKLFPILLSAEFSSTFKSTNMMARQWTFYSIGLEMKPLKWLPIRTGILFGDMPAQFSFGAGINTGHFDFDLGFGNITSLFLSESSKSVSFAFSTKFLF
jgi:hypothetical protein